MYIFPAQAAGTHFIFLIISFKVLGFWLGYLFPTGWCDDQISFLYVGFHGQCLIYHWLMVSPLDVAKPQKPKWHIQPSVMMNVSHSTITTTYTGSQNLARAHHYPGQESPDTWTVSSGQWKNWVSLQKHAYEAVSLGAHHGSLAVIPLKMQDNTCCCLTFNCRCAENIFLLLILQPWKGMIIVPSTSCSSVTANLTFHAL
jgi:hypothetical protein